MMQNSRRSSLDLLDAYSIYVGLPYYYSGSLLHRFLFSSSSVLFTSSLPVYRRCIRSYHMIHYMLCSMHKYVIVLFFSEIKLIILTGMGTGDIYAFQITTVTRNKTKPEH